MITKVRASDCALDANNKKFKMDVGLLGDLDEPELRSKTLKGCRNILFKQPVCYHYQVMYLKIAKA